MGIKIKRGEFKNLPNGELGEPLYTTDTKDLYIGNGKEETPTLIGGQIYNKKDGNKYYLWIGTQDEYDAITAKDDDTVYLIKQE